MNALIANGLQVVPGWRTTNFDSSLATFPGDVRFAGDGREFPDMLKNLGQEQRNCLAKAEECAGKAAEATTEEERLQYRRLEQSYLTLARSYEFSERLLDFTKENSRRLKAWVEDDSPAPFFAKGQQFIEPTRCERCGQPAQLMHRAPDTTRPRFEVRMFECVCGHYTRRVVKSSKTPASTPPWRSHKRLTST